MVRASVPSFALLSIGLLSLSGCLDSPDQYEPTHVAMDAVEAFRAEGLVARDAEEIERSDYADAPRDASTAVRFLAWECDDCWSHAFSFDSRDDHEVMFRHYNNATGTTYNSVFDSGNVVVALRGPFDGEGLAAYAAALEKHVS